MTDNMTCQEGNMCLDKYCWQPFHPVPLVPLLSTTPLDKFISVVILVKLIFMEWVCPTSKQSKFGEV